MITNVWFASNQIISTRLESRFFYRVGCQALNDRRVLLNLISNGFYAATYRETLKAIPDPPQKKVDPWANVRGSTKKRLSRSAEQRLDRRQAQRHRVFDLQIRIGSATENDRPVRIIPTMSAFGGKADMHFLHCTSPLLTESGHRLVARDPFQSSSSSSEFSLNF